MRARKGDWRDLLASHSLAVDAKKLWMGFIATLATVSLLAIMAMVYGRTFPESQIATLARFQGSDNIFFALMQGKGIQVLKIVLPLLNPFYDGLGHFAFSMFFYFLLLGIWTFCGGVISRLTALQYAKDDIPTLQDGLAVVRAKRKAYYFAPVTPLFGIILFAVCNMVIGLIGSIPVVGPWAMTVLVPFVSLPATIVVTFMVVLGVLTFGLMLPAVSIGGKDAFEGWSSAYSYLLWGFNRFVCYSLAALAVGVLTTVAAFWLAELFIYLLAKTVSMGLQVAGRDLVMYNLGGAGGTEGSIGPAIYPITEGVGYWAASWVTILVALVMRALVVAYAFSYFFTANTLVCFLMRKHVDRIDVDEVYEEELEEPAEAELDTGEPGEPQPEEPEEGDEASQQ